MVCNQGLSNTCLETITSLTHLPNVTMLLQKGFCPQGTLILLNGWAELTNMMLHSHIKQRADHTTSTWPQAGRGASQIPKCPPQWAAMLTPSSHPMPLFFILMPPWYVPCNEWYGFSFSLVTLDHIWFRFTVLGQFTRPLPKNLNFRFPLKANI